MNISAKEKVTILTLELNEQEIRVFKNMLCYCSLSAFTNTTEEYKLFRELREAVDKV